MVLMTDMLSCSVRRLIEAHPGEEAQGCEQDNAVALRLSRAECAELLQNYLFNLLVTGVREGKKVSRL